MLLKLAKKESRSILRRDQCPSPVLNRAAVKFFFLLCFSLPLLLLILFLPYSSDHQRYWPCFMKRLSVSDVDLGTMPGTWFVVFFGCFDGSATKMDELTYR